MKPREFSKIEILFADFELLAEEHKQVFNICVIRYEIYLAAISSRLNSMENKKGLRNARSSLEIAREKMIESAMALIWLELEARKQKTLGALSWYGKFYKAMSKEDRNSWDVFHALLFEDAATELEMLAPNLRLLD